MQRNNLQKQWSSVQSPTNQITVWDTGMHIVLLDNKFHDSKFAPTPKKWKIILHIKSHTLQKSEFVYPDPVHFPKLDCAGCPIDVLKWVGAKSVAVPENLVSIPEIIISMSLILTY